MTEVYKIIEADRKDECLLVCSETPYQKGLFVASVVFWKRTETASDMAIERFPSTQSIADAKAQAEGWIRGNLFPKYQATQLK
jgi:hypothetical protein